MSFRSRVRSARAIVIGGILTIILGATAFAASPVLAQSAPIPPTYPCGTSPGPIMECHYFEQLKGYYDEALGSFQFAVVTGLLNTLQFLTQKIAIDSAKWILNGGNGQGTAFYNKTAGEYFADVAQGAGNQFISDINKFTAKEWGFNLCAPVSFNLQLSLAQLSKMETLPPPDCTFKQIANSFEETYRSLEPAQMTAMIRQNMEVGGNELGFAIAANQNFFTKVQQSLDAEKFNRIEGGGLKPITDIISGNIKTPAQVAKDTVFQANSLKLVMHQSTQNTTLLALSALQAGLTQLPAIAGSTFINTLAVGLLQKFFDSLSVVGDQVAELNLLNPDAQASAERGVRTSPITDILTPNLISDQKQDFLFELSTCANPRGFWGCSIDSSFVAALQSVTENGGYTVARASGIGLNDSNPTNGVVFLHPEWELIPESEAKDNKDPGCYQRAYCATNLAKLRFARVISSGWELAANSPFNTKVNGTYVKLGDVIRGFNNCNDQGELDADHPWCHLIDPSWVLTIPQFQCRVKGYSDTLLASGVGGVRIQECSDVVSCLERNDRGECIGGYGYCLSEKTVWRFGADSCSERYVSCRTYKTRDKSKSLSSTGLAETATGPEVSYLRNSLDYGSCNADNVGCLMYRTIRNASVTGTVAWLGTQRTSPNATSTVDAVDWRQFLGARVYFDGTAETCDQSDAGCTKVYEVRPTESALNLVKNGSFENADAAVATKLAGWSNDLVPASEQYAFQSFVTTAGLSSESGGVSADFADGSLKSMHQRVAMSPLRNYVVSAFVRQGSSANASRNVSVSVRMERLPRQGDAAGSLIIYGDGVQTHLSDAVGTFYTSSNCTVGTGVSKSTGFGEEWQLITCEFVTPTDVAFGRVVVSGQGVAMDSVQLEEGPRATPFVDGLNTSLTATHLKLPPEELNCQGLDSDHPDCEGYAKICRQIDAGCQGYTEVGSGQLSEIPAIVNSGDLCPNTCVGYAEYHKLPSGFDLVQNPTTPFLNDPNDETSAFFIPKNAQLCSAAAVGCEEFTNVESAELGGESKLYATYARACLNPSKTQNEGLTRTYFTWEGSDTTGYQLRTWSLIQKGNDPSPFDPQYVGQAAAPRILRKAGPDGFVKDPSVCTSELWDQAVDPDCRQLYDEQGVVYYRYFSQTIVSSVDCRDYRKNSSNFDDCTKTGGEFNQQTNECIYHILAAESSSCSAVDASCRAYIGTTGRNTAPIFDEAFPNATGTAFVAENANTSASLSTESLRVGDYSLRIDDTDANPLTTSIVRTSFESTSGTLYSVSFWAKSTDPGKKTATVRVNTNQVIGTFQVETDWRRYELGPFRVAENLVTSTMSWISMPDVSFLDEVHIVRLQDVVYARQGQWTIPAECDQTVEGVPQSQAMLGCRSYVDRKNRTVDVRQFSRLCRFDAISCTAFVDTRDSVDPYAQSFTVSGVPTPNPADPTSKLWDYLYSGDVTVTRPADRYVYVVDEPSAHCEESAASCRAFGKPNYDPTLAVAPAVDADGNQIPGTEYETVWMKDDITKYVDADGELQTLCRPSELFCERYASQDATPAVVSYFRDPGPHTCEWREKVFLPTTPDYPEGEYSGWFVKNAQVPQPCYPRLLSRGNTFLFEYAGTPKYEGWVSTCPKDQSECTEFRDVNDTTDQAHPSGKPYFFINNQRLDKSSCGGRVDPFGGCVLFRDMNDSRLLYSTRATYDKSHAENDNAVAPIDCVKDPQNPYCQNRGACVEVGVNPLCTSPNAGQTSCPVAGGGSVQYSTNQINTAIADLQGAPCASDAQCSSLDGNVRGRCSINDANLILKVRLDRDCTTWLGCSTGETVYDPSQSKYVDLCTDVSVCDEGLGATGKNFCAHYVDRTPASNIQQRPGQPYREPVLRQGRFFDLPTYTNRLTGFNVPDYSGFSIPNHFQVADLEPRRVAYELLVNRKGASRDKYIRDYRLAAATPLRFGIEQENGPDIPGIFDGVVFPGYSLRYTDPTYEDLNLCWHRQTGRIGYYNPGESPARCYFAVDTPYTGDVSSVLTNQTQFNPRNITNIITLFEQLERADLEPQLSNAFPTPECRAYPDSQAPFPNQYVAEWDFTKDPPTPKRFVDGYEGVSYCEYGEACACSYRKASYTGGISRHYSLFGAPPAAGVCVGGSRNGQSCVPGSILGNTGGSFGSTDDPSTPADESIRGSETGGAQPADVCQGGTCQAIDTVSIVRGQFGYCLQRDASRSVAGSQAFNPCLIWNPTPVLFGPNDIYHYQPTAGYLPPQNAGEYYCIASARAPQEFDISALRSGSGTDPLGLGNWITELPGSLSQFYFDEDFISDGGCISCIGNDTNGDAPEDITFIDGVNAEGGQMGAWCESADDSINTGLGSTGVSGAMTGEPISAAILGAVINTSHFADTNAGRWVMTGRGQNRNYMEYFIPFNEKKWAASIYPGAPIFNGQDQAVSDDILLQATTERNFAYFNWDLMINPNGKGIMGCGATADWAEGVIISDYDSEEMLKQGQEQFQAYFRENFPSTMTRESSDFLKDDDGVLQKVQCIHPNSTGPNGDGNCFYKFWQIDYRAAGQEKFRMETVDDTGQKFEASRVYPGKSDASHPFFSIRAMFEDANSNDNELTEEEAGGDGNVLSGPFRFVGWWVTASFPGAADERAIYLTLQIGNADTCRQVAQVVAPDTREATAFNDRVWEGSGFSVPLLGYVYSSINPPFGSAVHTRPIGLDPLLQTHGPIPGTQSKIKPPGFIASGLEYFRTQQYPTGNWSWLNNLFARVYRVYKYYDQTVSENAGFCISGPNAGAFCPPEAISGSNNTPQDPEAAQKYCGFVGTCNTTLVDPEKAPGACNALSGVNAGLPCSGGVNDELQGYHVCHNAPVIYENGLPSPKYLGCEIADGWSTDNNGNYYPCENGNCPVVFQSDAAARGAFTCVRGSVRTFTGKPALCGKIEAVSKDCPMEVIGDGNVNASFVGGPNPDGYVHSRCVSNRCTNGFEHAECNTNSDCRFGAQEYWGKHNAEKPWGGVPSNQLQTYTALRNLPSMKDIVAGAGGNTDLARAIYTANESSWFRYHSDGDGYSGDLGSDGAITYSSYGQDRNNPQDWAEQDVALGRIWWTNHSLIHTGTSYDDGVGDSSSESDMGGKNLAGGGFVRFNYSDSQNGIAAVNRFPGAYAASVLGSDDVIFETIQNDADIRAVLMIPGHCERPPDTQMDNQVNPLDTIDEDDPAESRSVYRSDKLDKPYAEQTWFCGDKGDYDFGGGSDNPSSVVGGPDCNFDDSETDEPDVWKHLRRYYGGNGEWIYGICDGGSKEGSVCNQNADCKPTDLTNAQIAASAGWCKSPTDPALADQCTPDLNNDGQPDFSCDPESNNLDLDCNLCTHNSGYYPQTNLCGSDPLRPQCLTGYVLGTNERAASVNQNTTLPPTDVTQGFYTPNILGAPQNSSQLSYIAYYTPRGPTIAAPDTSRACASPGQCPISLINTFALENRAEGKIAYVGGQAISNIRFYGWTPDNQGGLKDLWVDWGDDMVQEFHDAKMKNRKPICNVGKECQFVPGLTCNTDNDCPPAGGKCVNTGSCSARPYISCLADSDCGSDDKCIARTGFGSSDLACEPNYFEFTHAYACGSEASDLLPSCQVGTSNTEILRCSRDNTRTCTSNAQCAPGDSCVAGLAPPGGCFDRVQNACRFTPRVLLKDNWGWCTGECRITDLGGGNLSSGAVGLQHVYYKNAGCYDSSDLYKNTNPTQKIAGNNGQPANSCDPSEVAGTSARPWIIYRGSLQLGIGE